MIFEWQPIINPQHKRYVFEPCPDAFNKHPTRIVEIELLPVIWHVRIPLIRSILSFVRFFWNRRLFDIEGSLAYL